MAIKYYERYPQRWESPSQDYPQGAFKNLSALGEQDGSYLEASWLNDQSGFFGALLRNAEMTPNGLVDTAQQSQFYDALVQIAKNIAADNKPDLSEYFKKEDITQEWGDSPDKVLSQEKISEHLGQDEDGNTVIKSSPAGGGTGGSYIFPKRDGIHRVATVDDLPINLNSNYVPTTGWGSGNGSFYTWGSAEVSSGGCIAIGSSTLKNSTSGDGCVAIGDGVFEKGKNPRLSVAIGAFSQHHSSSHRNDSIGTLSLFGLTSGVGNVAVGRDAGQNLSTGSYNLIAGYSAGGGEARMGFDNNIRTSYEWTGDGNVLLGNNAGTSISGNGSNNTLIGQHAGRNIKDDFQLIGIGRDSLLRVSYNKSFRGYEAKNFNEKAPYTFENNTVEVHSDKFDEIPVGAILYATFNSGVLNINGDRKTMRVTSKTSAGLTLVSHIEEDQMPSADGQGELTIISAEISLSLMPKSSHSVALGTYAIPNVRYTQYDVVIGGQAGQGIKEIVYSTIVGGLSCASPETVSNSTVMGYYSAGESKNVKDSVIIGRGSCRYTQYVQGSVVIGHNSGDSSSTKKLLLRDTVSIGLGSGWGIRGENASNNTLIGSGAGSSEMPQDIQNSTMIGYFSTVTGSNQVQLGNADTTTYVYGTVQNRSDARDKADIEELDLGLDFVMKLKPSEYRWNYREWGGKKTGKRKHVGFIAQDVNKVVNSDEYAFVQDHSVNGGSDVFSIGYDEFIPVLTKAIQEQQKQIEDLQELVKSLLK